MSGCCASKISFPTCQKTHFLAPRRMGIGPACVRIDRRQAFCFPWLGPPLEGDLGHGTARETMSRMPVVQIRRRIRTPRGISTDSCCCLQPLVLSAVRPSVYYRCLLVPHSVTQLLEQRWTCSSKHALTGCLLSLHLRMSLALGNRRR